MEENDKSAAEMSEVESLARRVARFGSRQIEEFGAIFSKAQAENRRMADAQLDATQGASVGGSGVYAGRQYPSSLVSLENIDEVMRYQPWDADQTNAGDQVREALVAAAKTILRNVPASPNRTKAINHIIDARMDANAAISFRGRF